MVHPRVLSVIYCVPVFPPSAPLISELGHLLSRKWFRLAFRKRIRYAFRRHGVTLIATTVQQQAAFNQLFSVAVCTLCAQNERFTLRTHVVRISKCQVKYGNPLARDASIEFQRDGFNKTLK